MSIAKKYNQIKPKVKNFLRKKPYLSLVDFKGDS